jgi:iron complex outermembrane receptor protein
MGTEPVKIQSRLKVAAAPIAISVALLTQPAFGQETEVPEPVSAVSGEDLEGADEEGTILVTGSRIRRSEVNSASPLQIIDPVISRRSGLNETAEIIQNSSIASGSSQINSAISVNAQGVNGGPGAQTVSLRGLGAERTLVLLNSRRAGPSGTRGGVSSFDLGVLPAAIIESVEILKDGASSVYGSDAIAGVVNILTKRDTDGIEIEGFVSQPFEDGGEEYSVSAAWGHDFGNGHLLFSGEYYRQEILRRRDRDFLDCDYDYLFRSETSDERVDLIDPRTGSEWCDGVTWGHVWAYYSGNLPDSPVTLLQYNYGNDNLQNYIPGLAPATQPGDLIAPDGWFPVSYQTAASNSVVNNYHPFEQKSSVIPQTDRYTLYGQGSLEIGDSIEVYGEGLFNRRETYHDTLSQFYNFGLTNLYAPGDPDDPFPGFGGFGGEPQFLSPTGILDNYDQQINVDYYRGVLGVRGDITDNISFDVHGQYSRSNGKYFLDQILQDVITQQTNRAYGYGCAGQVTQISNRECLQINWVDPRIMAGDFTPAEEAYFTETEMGQTIYTQKFVEAAISGELFELPAGAIGFAAGAVYRRDSIDDLPGHITYAENPDFDPSLPEDDNENPSHVDNAFSNDFSSGHTFGYSITKEAFAEVEVPIFRDQPFAESFTIAAAGRVTNVKATGTAANLSDSSNGNFTYSLKANWQVTDWLRLRGTYGTSYRAPALFEQFLAAQVSGVRQSTVDPCVRWAESLAETTISDRVAANCAAAGIPEDHTGAGLPALVYSSGGIGVLDPETSRAWTASIILTPRFEFLPDTDIDLTVDYFDIEVKDEISQLAAYSILYNCYDAEDYPNSEFCTFFERGADGNPNNVSRIDRKFINVDVQQNRGFDFTLRATHDLGSAGRISLLGQATLQTKDSITTLGDLEDLNGEVGDPKFTADINAVWDIDDWSLFYGIDLIGKSDSRPDFLEDNGTLCTTSPDFIPVYGGDYCFRPYTKTVVYHNVSVTKEFLDRFQITAGISNLLDTRPPEVSGVTEIGSSPFVSQYDWLGRRLFVNFGAKF